MHLNWAINIFELIYWMVIGWKIGWIQNTDKPYNFADQHNKGRIHDMFHRKDVIYRVPWQNTLREASIVRRKEWGFIQNTSKQYPEEWCMPL